MGIVGTELETVALNNGTFSLKTADELQIACKGWQCQMIDIASWDMVIYIQ